MNKVHLEVILQQERAKRAARYEDVDKVPTNSSRKIDAFEHTSGAKRRRFASKLFVVCVKLSICLCARQNMASIAVACEL